MKSIITISATIAVLSLSNPKIVQANKILVRYNIIQDNEAEYREITIAEIPEVVTKTLEKEYSGYVTQKAFRGNDGTFKIVVSKGKTKEILVLNKKGEVIKVKVPESAS
ncbi:MAG: hypothetical protein WC384_02975 [Prolixibacteraceae bacterium]|jgi:hypothetical protein